MLNYELYIGAIDLSPYIAEKRNTSIWLVDVPADVNAAMFCYFNGWGGRVRKPVFICDRKRLFPIVASPYIGNYEREGDRFSDTLKLSILEDDCWVWYRLRFFDAENWKAWNRFGDVLEKRLHV